MVDFNNRNVPWYGVGKNIGNALNVEQAMKMAELDWTVEPQRVYVGNTDVVPVDGYWANVRKEDSQVLGIVSNRYTIVQNTEAFDFTNYLLGQGVKYVNAGALNGGRRIWLAAKLPDVFKLANEQTDVYLIFYNSHNGLGSIRIFITPVRPFCSNVMNMALRKAYRSWSAIHSGDMDAKLEEARQTLEITHEYMNELTVTVDDLASKNIDNAVVEELVERLYPIDEEMGNKRIENVTSSRNELLHVYNNAPDLQHFRGTAWGMLSAVSDHLGHSQPKRRTATFEENRMDKIVTGHPLFDKAVRLLEAV